mmetsp:Transcript_1928/g.4062  ORF Transcript_1928/g.4062 Transcript_1928/m.4062 type:complete len:200 (-) Transcript_1928:14-613(-)
MPFSKLVCEHQKEANHHCQPNEVSPAHRVGYLLHEVLYREGVIGLWRKHHYQHHPAYNEDLRHYVARPQLLFQKDHDDDCINQYSYSPHRGNNRCRRKVVRQQVTTFSRQVHDDANPPQRLFQPVLLHTCLLFVLGYFGVGVLLQVERYCNQGISNHGEDDSNPRLTAFWIIHCSPRQIERNALHLVFSLTYRQEHSAE